MTFASDDPRAMPALHPGRDGRPVAEPVPADDPGHGRRGGRGRPDRGPVGHGRGDGRAGQATVDRRRPHARRRLLRLAAAMAAGHRSPCAMPGAVGGRHRLGPVASGSARRPVAPPRAASAPDADPAGVRLAVLRAASPATARRRRWPRPGAASGPRPAPARARRPDRRTATRSGHATRRSSTRCARSAEPRVPLAGQPDARATPGVRGAASERRGLGLDGDRCRLLDRHADEAAVLGPLPS